MDQFMMEGNLSTESLKKIKEILKKENGTIQQISKNEKERRKQLEEQIEQIVKNDVQRIAREFMEDHAISYKQEGEILPSYFQIQIGSEYDDENYFSVIQDVTFFDEEKEYLGGIEVEEDTGYDIEELSTGEALASRFSRSLSVLEVEKYGLDEMMKIDNGK